MNLPFFCEVYKFWYPFDVGGVDIDCIESAKDTLKFVKVVYTIFYACIQVNENYAPVFISIELSLRDFIFKDNWVSSQPITH